MAEMKTVQFTGGARTEGTAGVEAPAITDWTHEPKVEDLKVDVDAATQSHNNHITNIKRWRALMSPKEKADVKKVAGRSTVQPKLIRRQAEWRYSALTEPFLGSEKLYDVDPITFEDDAAARQNELLLNWQFRTKINRVRFIDEFVRTNVDEGSAIIRVGWLRTTKKAFEDVPQFSHVEPSSQEDIQNLQNALQLREMDPRGYSDLPEELRAAVDFYEETGQPNVAIQTGVSQVEVEKIINNKPTLEIINPENFYIDPSCGGDQDKAVFMAVSFETSKADLLKEPGKYKNLEFVNWETAVTAVSTEHSSSTPVDFNYKDNLRKRVVAYEYWGLWDIAGNDELVPIVATWIGNTMIRMERNPFPDERPPFIITNYMPIKRELMGEPDAELLEDNQKILGALTRGMIDLLGRSANSQQGMAKGLLDVINKRRYELGQDYEFNPNLNPAQNIIEHTYPEIPQSAYNMLTLQNQEAEALTGVKSFSGGMSGEAYGDVAAGIRGVLDASAKREMAILRRLAKGITDIGTKFVSMNAEFLSEKEVIRVTNDKFVEVKREDLAGNFDLSVDISTAEVDNQKAQDMGFMLQTMGPNMDFSFSQIILAEIAELKRMPALAHKIKTFEPKPDPLVQKLKELEIEKVQMEIAVLQSTVEKNKADAQKKMAEADATNLDVVETETGTKHERDLEKQRAQATGNQSLEVTKALLKSRKRPDGGEEAPNVEAAVGWNEMSKRLPSNSRPSMGNISPPINRNITQQNGARLPVNSEYFGSGNGQEIKEPITI